MKNSILYCLTLILASCSNFDYQGEGKDVPTAGKINIWADFADSLMLTQIKDVFESKYPKSTLRFTFASETDILKAVNDGSCRVCVLHRDFFPQEKEALENRNFKVRSVKFAKSSIAVVANKTLTIDFLHENDLVECLKNRSQKNKYQLVFDKLGGNNFMYFYRRYQIKEKPSSGIISMPDPYSVIDWVAKHPGSIGFVGINTLSDQSDTMAMHYQRKIKILTVMTDSTEASYPFQSQIYTRRYPFVQHVFIHDLQGYSGLGAGLAAWICSQPGQILVKKSGLLPCFDAGRTIEVDTE